MNKLKLTDKQKLFVHAYIANGFNGSKAAIDAGYSKNCSRVIATENLSKPNIVQYKDSLVSKLANSLGCSPESVFNKLKECMDLNPKKHGATVLKATELVGKHHKLFGERIETVTKTHEQWLEDIKDE